MIYSQSCYELNPFMYISKEMALVRGSISSIGIKNYYIYPKVRTPKSRPGKGYVLEGTRKKQQLISHLTEPQPRDSALHRAS